MTNNLSTRVRENEKDIAILQTRFTDLQTDVNEIKTQVSNHLPHQITAMGEKLSGEIRSAITYAQGVERNSERRFDKLEISGAVSTTKLAVIIAAITIIASTLANLVLGRLFK